MPQQTFGMTFDSCDAGCNTDMVSVVNNYSTNTAFNYTGTSTNGIVFRSPITYMYTYTATTQSSVGGEYYGRKDIYDYQNETYPFSGSPGSYTRIPELSGKTCPDMSAWGPEFNGDYQSYHYAYRYELASTTNRVDFRIYAYEISSTHARNPLIKTLVYEKIGGVVTVANAAYLV